MARLPTQSMAAASGVDLSSDPVAMSISRARALINFQLDRSGLVHNNVSLVNQLTVNYPDIDGIGYYYQALINNNQSGITFNTDLVMWATSGFLVIGVPAVDPLTGTITGDSPVLAGSAGITGYSGFGAFFVGKRVRFFAYGDEMIIVQDGGLLPLRFYSSLAHGTGFYRAGIQPPVSTGAYTNLSLAPAGLSGPTLTWSYKLTFADERDRESSPTSALAITLVNRGTQVTWSTLYAPPPTAYIGHNLVTAYLYRNTVGEPSVFYRIAAHTLAPFVTSGLFDTNDFFFNPSPQPYDFAPDADITTGALAPSPGENDPPAAASVGTVYRNHIVLNDVNDPNTIQISNLSSTVQYALIPTLPFTATDGLRAQIGTDQGNVITAFAEFGSYLAIFKRRGCFYLTGNTLADFNVQPMHARGCIAPDSCVRCDNVVMFLSDDGVYAAAYQGGEVTQKVSKEIETELMGHPLEFREAACGAYVDSCYLLTVESTIYCYNFDAQGWSMLVFGSGELFGPGVGFGEGIPVTSVTSRVGFTLIGAGDAGTYGAFVPNDGDCPEQECDIGVTPSTIGALAAGGSFDIAILAQNQARITYAASDAWVHVSGPISGSGTAAVTVDANTACVERSSMVTICDEVVTVTQAAATSNCCDVTVLPTSISAPFTGETVQVDVVLVGPELPSGSSDVGWIHVGVYVVDSPTTGHFMVVIDANPDCDDRDGNITICNQVIPVDQAGNPDECDCSVSFSPTSATFAYPFTGNVGFMLTATNAAPNTPASTDVPGKIFNILYPASGSGPCSFDVDSFASGPAWIVFDANTFVGHVTICDATFSLFLTHS